MGFLGVRFEVVGEGGLCQKLQIWHENTYIKVVLEIILFNIKPLLILLISSFLQKNQHFLAKIVPLLKATVGELLEIF